MLIRQKRDKKGLVRHKPKPNKTWGLSPQTPSRHILIVFYPGQSRGEKRTLATGPGKQLKQALATDPGKNNDHQFTRNDEIKKKKISQNL